MACAFYGFFAWLQSKAKRAARKQPALRVPVRSPRRGAAARLAAGARFPLLLGETLL